jgi:hypothetical protein
MPCSFGGTRCSHIHCRNGSRLFYSNRRDNFKSHTVDESSRIWHAHAHIRISRFPLSVCLMYARTLTNSSGYLESSVVIGISVYWRGTCWTTKVRFLAEARIIRFGIMARRAFWLTQHTTVGTGASSRWKQWPGVKLTALCAQCWG